MNEFKNAYHSALKDIKEYHIDAADCMDEKGHRRRALKLVRRHVTAAFSVMCLVFVCGFGTVTAADYIKNVIKVSEKGFESADAATMALNEASENDIHIINEEMKQAEPQIRLSAEAATGDGTEAAAEAAIEEIPVQTYSSFEEFEENEDIIFPQPSIKIGNNISSTDITVCGNWALVRYDVDGKVLWLERSDYSNSQGHVSSKVFAGGVNNERSYTTPQGYTYTLVDSLQGENAQSAIHAAVTVNNYEIFMDFTGFEQAEAEKIIDSVDLSLYQ